MTTTNPNKNDQQIIDQIILSFRVYNLGDIKQSRIHNANIGAFTLCGCLIDQLSRYRYFNIKSDIERFKEFADHYMPRFKGKGHLLYTRFRNSLVHNYSIKGYFTLAWGDPTMHLQPYGNGQIILDLDEFIQELEKAFETYAKELNTNTGIRQLALLHYKSFPIMSQLQ